MTSIKVANVEGPQKRIPFEDAIKLSFQDAKIGDTFGPSWSTHWFKLVINIPKEWVGERVDIMWDSSSEALLYDENGNPLSSFTGISWQKRDEYIWFSQPVTTSDLKTYTFYVEMACNDMFGSGQSDYLTPEDNRYNFALNVAQIATRDIELYDFYINFRIIADIALLMNKDTQRAADALYVANNIINNFNWGDRNSLSKCQDIANDFLRQKNGESAHQIYAIGHSHIDLCWLWPFAETKRKCARTFSTQLHLLDLYPHYKYAQSSAFVYMWTKEMHPQLFERIKQKIRENRWIVVGGALLESCGILPGAESFVRQYLYGQRFFQHEFGKMATIGWMPDSFGYHGQLPQIMKLSGIQHFVTQKLSWNQFNSFPNSTFHWKGLDGTSIISHFPPADTYNSEITIDQLLYQVSNFKDRHISKSSLSLFGYGDGGGGANPNMITRLKEGKLNDTDGMPKIKVEDPAKFFEEVEKEDQIRGFATWEGELYLERHRGTYTSQSRVKKGNRMSEIALRNLEILALLDKSHIYPYDEIYNMWLSQILQTFHDSLPGSSIRLAYDEVHKAHAELLEKSSNLIQRALQGIANDLFSPVEKQDAALVFNTLSWTRVDIIELPESFESVQKSYRGNPLGMVSSPSVGFSINPPNQWNIKFPESHLSIKETELAIIMANQHIQVTISKEHGTLVIYDSRQGVERATITKGNQFVIFENITTNYDAWEIEIFDSNKYEILNNRVKQISIVENGPLRVAVSLTIKLSDTSELRQIISLTPLASQVNFETEVDWLQEKHVHLKVLFQTDIQNEFATYGTQFGTIRRPTHFNTSWDLGRFEVCGHGFADLSEFNYGVALLSDYKFGWMVRGSDMYISLLRAPKQPDDQCDMEKGHKFTYACFVHTGSHQQARVSQRAYELQTPLYVIPAPTKELSVETLTIDNPAIIVESIKNAEDSKYDIIVRLWESFGSHAKFNLTIRKPLIKSSSISRISAVNLLETEILSEYNFKVNDDAIVVEGIRLSPFQILTLRFAN